MKTTKKPWIKLKFFENNVHIYIFLQLENIETAEEEDESHWDIDLFRQIHHNQVKKHIIVPHIYIYIYCMFYKK